MIKQEAVRQIGGLSLLLVAAGAQATAWTVQVRNPAGEAIANAVVAVEVRGQVGKTAKASAQVEQRQRQFLPFVLVVQTGTAVSFPNFDTVRHHVYSFSATKKFDVKLYAGTPAEPVLFDKPGVATLGCNIHDGMSAHIVVVDTPFFGKTDGSGRLTLELPPGVHLLRSWHPSLAQPLLSTQTLAVPATPEPKTFELVLGKASL